MPYTVVAVLKQIIRRKTKFSRINVAEFVQKSKGQAGKREKPGGKGQYVWNREGRKENPE